jgi:HEAT repeat protein
VSVVAEPLPGADAVVTPPGDDGSAGAVERALGRVLQQGDDAQRCFAARALGRIGARDALQPLIGATQDPDEDVRCEAVDALGQLGGAEAVAALLDSLRLDPCGDVKRQSVLALEHLTAKQAVPLLRDLVRGRGDQIVWNEMEILDGWDIWLDVQIDAIRALASFRVQEAVPDIVAALLDEEAQDLSDVATRSLAALGTLGVNSLGQLLDDRDDRRRRAAARALRDQGSTDCLTVLTDRLADVDPDIREAALVALAEHDRKDPRLARFFEDAAPRLRAKATALIGPGHPHRLAHLLDDPSEEVQLAAVTVVAEQAAGLDIPDLLPRLRLKIRGPSELVAIAALPALPRLDPAVALADLTEQLQDKSCPTALRAAAARTLADLGSETVVSVLASAVDEGVREVRYHALMTLGRIAQEATTRALQAKQTLLAALRGELVPAPEAVDEEPAEPPAAEPQTQDETDGRSPPQAATPTSTLAAIFGPERAAQLTGIERGSDSHGGLTPEDVRRLEQAAARPRRKHVALEPEIALHRDVRLFAAKVLGDLPETEVLEALADCLESEDRELARTASDSLARAARSTEIAKAVISQVLAALDSDDLAVKLNLVPLLGVQDDVTVQATLSRLIRDPEPRVRTACLRASTDLETPGFEAAHWLDDPDPGVALAAAEALAGRGNEEATVNLLTSAVFLHDGVNREAVAGLLRRLDPPPANAALITVLQDEDQRRSWRIAIEVLEVLNRPDTPSALP